MSSKSKRGGRVTARGTQPPKKTPAERRVLPATPDPFDERVTGKVRGASGRAARPLTHHRGNR